MNLRKIITLSIVFAIIIATLFLKAHHPHHGHDHVHALESVRGEAAEGR
ncbi:MAG: hypothetical protein SOZ52_02300 [Pyramidobacter sp.]|nr:hypothetical protein [Pyramidobacter sp.]